MSNNTSHQVSVGDAQQQLRQVQHLVKQSHLLSAVIGIREFLNSRQREVLELQSNVEKKYNGSYSSNVRVFQRLPRYKRRRVMSFNIHLLPKHLRRAAQHEIKLPSKVNKRKKRKVKRRIAQKNLQNKLATHMFHVKRMAMAKRWKLYLHFHSIHKIFRNSFRFLKRFSILHDASYWLCYQIQQNINEQQQQQQNHLIEFLRETFLIENISNKVEYSTILYQQQQQEAAMNFCIGPVKFHLDHSKRCCFLFVHAACAEEAVQYIEGQLIKKHKRVLVMQRRADLVRFEIRGPQSSKSLGSLPVLPHSLWRQIQLNSMSYGRAGYLPQNMILGLRVKREGADARSEAQAQTEQDAYGAIQLPLLKTPDGLQQGVQDLATTAEKSDGSSIPLLLIQKFSSTRDGSASVGEGWDIICDRTVGAKLFFTLAKSKTIVVGIQERNRLLEHELGRPAFPNDYPDSAAFQRDALFLNSPLKRKEERSLSHNPFYALLPKQQQVLFERHEEQKSRFGGEYSYTHVNLSVIKGSLPEFLAPIYCRVNGQTRRRRRNRDEVVPKGEMTEGEFQEVGFVTSSFFSQLRGKNMIVGYCLKTRLEDESQSGHTTDAVLYYLNGQILYPCKLE